MALPKTKLPYSDPDDSVEDVTQPTAGSYGSSVKVDESDLEPESRVIRSVSQAYEVTQTDITEAQKLIVNAGLITNLKQGARPYNPATLRNLNEGYKTNISTRAFGTELNRAAPRMYMPVLTASTMTAAVLPAGWPNAANKTALFRETITSAIRSWRKNDFFWRGLGKEVVDYGFAFACCLDKYDWRPSLVRMDRGFMPRGTEVMEENPGRFVLLLDYKPNELLDLARRGVDTGGGGWNKEAVAAAVQAADLPATDYTLDGLRKWEELIREASWDFSYTKGVRVVKTRHLLVLEATGKVSYYIIWADGPSQFQLLMERLDAWDSMNDAVTAIVFGYGDGTIQGAWGAGHILYDMAVQLDQLRCDNLDNLKLGNKLKIQVPDPKDINQVKLVVNSTAAILSNGQFSQNVGGIAPATESYQIADADVSRWMQEAIGAYLPPIPLTSSDVKAAQVNAALQQQQEVERDVLECWLKQVAVIVQMMTKRLCDKDSPDKVAKQVRKTLLEGRNGLALTEEEIDLLVNQPAVQSVTDFTQYAASQRGAFAASVKGDTRFNQTIAARMQAEAVGGIRLADEMVIGENDNSLTTAAARQQILETTSMTLGTPVPVLVQDLHEVHMQTLNGPLQEAIKAGMLDQAKLGLQHLVAHWEAGVSTRTIPKDKINEWKSVIARYQAALEELAKEKAQQPIPAQNQPVAPVEQFPQATPAMGQ